MDNIAARERGFFHAGKLKAHGYPAFTQTVSLAGGVIAHSWARRGGSNSFAVPGGDASSGNSAAHSDSRTPQMCLTEQAVGQTQKHEFNLLQDPCGFWP